MLTDDVETGKAILRGDATETPSKSLIRTFSSRGKQPSF